MPRKGHDLVAPIKELLKAGRQTLPTIAGEYAGAANSLDRTRYDLSAVFRRPTYFSADPLGPVCGPWTQLRDILQGILAQTSVYLHDAGTALCVAAKAYQDADTVAAKELENAAMPVAVQAASPAFPPAEQGHGGAGFQRLNGIQSLPGFPTAGLPAAADLPPWSGQSGRIVGSLDASDDGGHHR